MAFYEVKSCIQGVPHFFTVQRMVPSTRFKYGAWFEMVAHLLERTKKCCPLFKGELKRPIYFGILNANLSSKISKYELCGSPISNITSNFWYGSDLDHKFNIFSIKYQNWIELKNWPRSQNWASRIQISSGRENQFYLVNVTGKLRETSIRCVDLSTSDV